ncbi:coil containing protein [Vibrio phage 1.101.O._10N.261.45.C6]|nr:coil containing protein [Vibrio phage 1.101.O._10N.261.45.C6]
MKSSCNKMKEYVSSKLDLLLDKWWNSVNKINLVEDVVSVPEPITTSDTEKVAALHDEFINLVLEYQNIVPHQYFTVSLRKKSIVIQIKESCNLTEYVRYSQGDDSLFIESSELHTIKQVQDYMQYIAHLEQERKRFKRGE